MVRIAMLVVAASLFAATGATAQIGDLGGTIVHIDPIAHTITFDNGRIVHYDPLWRVLVNGRPVAYAEIITDPAFAARAGTPARVVVTPGAPQPAAAPATPAVTVVRPAEPAGGVARVERTTTQTFITPDGRAVRVTEVEVWRGRPTYAVQPGNEMYIGVPVAVLSDGTVVSAAPAPAAIPARVQTVDARGTVIVFGDGQTVLLPARTWRTTRSATDPVPAVAVAELKAGDEVSVQLQEVVPVVALSERISGPSHNVVVARGDRLFPIAARVVDDQVVLIRYPQAQ